MQSIRKKFLTLLIIGSLTTGFVTMASAEETEVVNFNLEQVVVTATKTVQKIQDAPGTVEVITAEEMKKRHIRMVSDVLRLIPGVYLRHDKGLIGDNGSETLNMRGFSGAKYVALLIDGQPINNGYNGRFNFSNISIEDVERIEVMKGSSSVLYGSNAMGGVVNIITKTKPLQATTIHATIGGQGTKSGSISNSGSAGKLDYFFNLEKIEMDGYVTTKDADGKNGMDRESYQGKFIYHFDQDSKLSIAAGKSDHSYFYEKNANRGDNNEDRIAIAYEKVFDPKNALKISYGQNKATVKSTFNTKKEYIPSTARQGEIQYNVHLSEKDLLTVGYVYKTENLDYQLNAPIPLYGGNNHSQGKTSTSSFYLQEERRLDEDTKLYLGLRYDDWSLKDVYQYRYNPDKKLYEGSEKEDVQAHHISPKIALVHHVNDQLTVRGSMGKGFSAPTMFQFFTQKSSSGGQIYLPNINLQPEESVNYELGLDYQFDKSLLGKVTFFYSDLEKQIIDAKIGEENGMEIYQRQNAGKSKIKGIEVGFNKAWTPAWSSFINYTYTDAKIKENAENPDLIGKQIDLIPKNLFNIGISYQKDKWSGSLTGNYVSDPRENDVEHKYLSYESYFVLDFKAVYAWNKDNSIALSIDNLLDKDYYSVYKAPPRTVYLELTTKF